MRAAYVHDIYLRVEAVEKEKGQRPNLSALNKRGGLMVFISRRDRRAAQRSHGNELSFSPIAYLRRFIRSQFWLEPMLGSNPASSLMI